MVGITSVEPLVAYVHSGNVPVRLCEKEYVRDIIADTPQQTYVVQRETAAGAKQGVC